MTTSGPSQPKLFEDGSERHLPNMLPTPLAGDAKSSRNSTANRSSMPPTGIHAGDTLTDRVTLEPSTSSPGATPASHSLSPGSDWARKMTGISGRQLLPWLPNSSLNGVFSRMFTDTFRWGSMQCWLTWRRSVTPAGRSLFLLRPSVPRIGATEFGFWPTPNVAGGGNQCQLTPHKGHFLRPSGEKAHLGLDQAVRMYPTPTASEATGAGHTGQGAPNLRTVVAMFPTPVASEVRQGFQDRSRGMKGSQESLTTVVMKSEGMLPTPRAEGFDAGAHRGSNDSLHSAVKATTNGKLSAAWVTRLMGYPDGWLDLAS